MRLLILFAFLTPIMKGAIGAGLFAQNPTPAPAQSKSILLMNGVAHLGNGKVIENSAIGFKDGKLILVADATTVKVLQTYDTIINIFGKHVYPGFIAPNSTLGLSEIGAVRATLDYSETGAYNPHVRSITSYNSDSKIPPTVRTNGVLIAQITPRNGIISGTSSVIELDGWNWEDMVLKMDDGIHLNWSRMFKRDWGKNEDANEIPPLKKSEDYEKQKNELTKFFNDAKAYHEAEKQTEKNLRLEAMKGIFSGTKTLFVHVNYVKEIEDAINFSKELSVKKMVIVGGMDSWMVTDLLKENNISVMVNRLHDLPNRTDDDIDLPYKLPALLQKAGVLICLENSGDMEAIHARNIPFLAGTAAAYGLTKEEALSSITLNTAKILGIDNRVGSLEEGKDATLFVSTGDALDIKTNNVEWAFIHGKTLDLSNEQKALNEKYLKKYGVK